MAEKKRRGQNFTSNEKEKLVKILATHKNVILNKKTDGTTNNAKNEAWINVCNRFNSTGDAYRSRESLSRVWEKMKSEAKVYNSIKKLNISGTGGGPSSIKTDPILDQVCELMGRGCSGIADVDDSDASVVCNVNCNDTVINIIPEEYIQVSNKENENEIKGSLIEEEIYTPQITNTPMWKRRRPALSTQNERSEMVASVCSGFKNVNNKKCEIEEMKKELLQDEIKFKKQLYDLQLETARKELEIKIEVLNQLKGGAINLKDLYKIPASTNNTDSSTSTDTNNK